MVYSRNLLNVIFAILISACGASPSAPEQAPLPIILITSAPNATATPTPFQPSLFTATLTLLYSFDVNAPQFNLPSETPSPTALHPIEPTATISLDQLFPTQALRLHRHQASTHRPPAVDGQRDNQLHVDWFRQTLWFILPNRYARDCYPFGKRDRFH